MTEPEEKHICPHCGESNRWVEHDICIAEAHQNITYDPVLIIMTFEAHKGVLH